MIESTKNGCQAGKVWLIIVIENDRLINYLDVLHRMKKKKLGRLLVNVIKLRD